MYRVSKKLIFHQVISKRIPVEISSIVNSMTLSRSKFDV